MSYDPTRCEALLPGGGYRARPQCQRPWKLEIEETLMAFVAGESVRSKEKRRVCGLHKKARWFCRRPVPVFVGTVSLQLTLNYRVETQDDLDARAARAVEQISHALGVAPERLKRSVELGRVVLNAWEIEEAATGKRLPAPAPADEAAASP